LLTLLALLWGTSPASPAAAAWSGGGSGTGAGRAMTMPAVGTVRAVCGTGGSVSVSWDPVAPATAYTVWRSDNLGAWTMVGARAPRRR
jgi:hypothetical protein